MLIKTKPSTARCNDETYTSYLLCDPLYTSCTRLSNLIDNVSHDSINRFLERERFEPKDLFDEEKNSIELNGGILSVDDSVLDKPYMDSKKASLVDYYWSGKHKRTVKGINLITLFYTDMNGISVPVNYRIYNKDIQKTKNDYFLEMLKEVLAWGLQPAWVTGDSWYSSLGNMKFIRKLGLNFMFGIENNRTVSIERGQYIQIQKLEDWPDDEQTVYLKDYGMVKVFRQIYKKSYRYYIMSHSKLDELPTIKKADFERVHAAHWSIERYHRALKQVCNIERFQVRKENQIKNHVFCALKGFVRLEMMRFEKIITHWYEVKRDLFIKPIREFIAGNTNFRLPVLADPDSYQATSSGGFIGSLVGSLIVTGIDHVETKHAEHDIEPIRSVLDNFRFMNYFMSNLRNKLLQLHQLKIHKSVYQFGLTPTMKESLIKKSKQNSVLFINVKYGVNSSFDLLQLMACATLQHKDPQKNNNVSTLYSGCVATGDRLNLKDPTRKKSIVLWTAHNGRLIKATLRSASANIAKK